MRYARYAGMVLFLIGLLLIGYALYDVAGGKIYQAWRGRELDRALDTLPPRPATAQRVSYERGSAIGRLEIPRLGISVVVLEGSDAGALRLGVGRVRNSALPEEPGNVVLAGHRDTFFRALRDIRPGDGISLRTPAGMFTYKVDWTTVVDPSDTRTLLPTKARSLTLVTCYPFSYVGSAPQRFIVRAIPPGATTTVSDVPTRRPSPMPLPMPLPVVVPRPAPSMPVAAAAAVPPAEETEVAEPENAPPPDRRHGIKGFFHKIGGVFSPHRAKLQ